MKDLDPKKILVVSEHKKVPSDYLKKGHKRIAKMYADGRELAVARANRFKGEYKGYIYRTHFLNALLNLKNEPLSYWFLEFWREILNSARLSVAVPPERRKMVWKNSRQTGKSVNAGALAIGLSVENKNFTTVITQPTDKQISRFSVDILKRMNRDSVITETWYYDNKLNERQVKNKSYTTGSRIVLANIFSSVLSARGISADFYHADEYQDTPEHHATIIEEALSRSPFRYMVKSGTPLQPENPLQKEFDRSTGHEWMIKCGKCNTWNGPLGIKNIGKYGTICYKCGAEIYTRFGIWAAAQPSAVVKGYHCNELMVPPGAEYAATWPEIIFKLENKTTLEFMNEVLGMSYSDNKHPISRQDVISVCDPGRCYVRETTEITPRMKRYAYAGLDWATETRPGREKDKIKSFTTLVIGSFIPDINKIEINYVKRYYDLEFEDSNNPIAVTDDIIKWVNAFSVRVLGMDYGAGHKENMRLSNILGYDRTMELQYLGGTDDKVVYSSAALKWILNRSRVMEDFIEAFVVNKTIRMAKYDGETSEYSSDLTTVYKYHDPAKRSLRYGKSGPDDLFHSLLFMRLAFMFDHDKLSYVTN